MSMPMHDDPDATWLVFRLREQSFALALAHVRRVVAAARPSPLPGAPAGVLGVIDLQGEPVPVLDVAQGLWRDADDLQLDDRFLIVDTGTRVVALVVQHVSGIIHAPSRPLEGLDGLAGDEALPYAGVTRNDDGLVLIHDVERFVSVEMGRALDDALRSVA